MADFTAETDYREWEAALNAMQLRLWRASFTASQQGMYLIERNVKNYLRTFTHPYGTPTTSPRGGPPALVSGDLRRSWPRRPVSLFLPARLF